MFEFELEQKVEIKMSGEKGIVVGRSEHIECDSQYHVRYVAADGTLTEAWYTKYSIKAV